MKLSLFYPIKPFFIAQGFGENKIPLYRDLGMAGHNGLDLPCVVGRPIFAAHEGEVTYAGVDGKEGYGIVIRTLEPYESFNGVSSYWKTIYWHVLKDIPVRVGQEVAPGDIIGYGDTTGYATGPHLHFGLKPIAQGENEWTWSNINQNNGYFGAVDLLPYLSGMYSEDAKIIINILRQLIASMSLLITFLKRKSK